MEVILKQDVRKLGSKDDVVKVKAGYGRNFLIPRGLAVMADDNAKKIHAEVLKQRAHKEARIKDEAEKSAEKLKGMVVKVGAKVGESGKIFGSVNAIQLAEAIKKLGFDVERKNISLDEEAIKSVGSYQASVKLHKEVIAKITFEVVEG
ncbi:MAG: 50S ribosomal protein L9 [Bacteroidia bacterium]|nr:50S ribosomal protein L9 [Bacteroidia bacterium]